MIRVVIVLLQFFVTAFVFPAASSNVPYAFPNPFFAEAGKKALIVVPDRLVGKVRITLYSSNGDFISKLKKIEKKGGRTGYSWDGTSFEGKKVKSGVYIVYISSSRNGSGIISFRLLLFR